MPITFEDEQSSLLPKTYSDGNDEEDQFPALDINRESFKAMKKVVHNDPGVDEDIYEQLWGSTTLLKNSIEQDLPQNQDKQSLFKRFSNSFSMTLDNEFDNMSATSFGRESVTSKRASGFHASFAGLTTKEQNIRDSMNPNDNYVVFSEMRKFYSKQVSRPSTLYLKKIRNNFFSDAKSLAEGTIPQSIVLAIIIGIVCGVAAYAYYSVLTFGLDYIWEVLPERLVKDNWKPENYWLWIPLVQLSMCFCVGLTVVVMGEPGDLPYTISRVHAEAYIPMNHVMPMVWASLFSIFGAFSKISRIWFISLRRFLQKSNCCCSRMLSLTTFCCRTLVLLPFVLFPRIARFNCR